MTTSAKYHHKNHTTFAVGQSSLVRVVRERWLADQANLTTKSRLPARFAKVRGEAEGI